MTSVSRLVLFTLTFLLAGAATAVVVAAQAPAPQEPAVVEDAPIDGRFVLWVPSRSEAGSFGVSELGAGFDVDYSQEKPPFYVLKADAKGPKKRTVAKAVARYQIVESVRDRMRAEGSSLALNAKMRFWMVSGSLDFAKEVQSEAKEREESMEMRLSITWENEPEGAGMLMPAAGPEIKPTKSVYGTHYADRVVRGGEITIIARKARSQTETIQSQRSSLKATLKGWGQKLGVSSDATKQNEDSASSSSVDVSISMRGGSTEALVQLSNALKKPDDPTKELGDWVRSVAEFPTVLRFRLVPYPPDVKETPKPPRDDESLVESALVYYGAVGSAHEALEAARFAGTSASKAEGVDDLRKWAQDTEVALEEFIKGTKEYPKDVMWENLQAIEKIVAARPSNLAEYITAGQGLPPGLRRGATSRFLLRKFGGPKRLPDVAIANLKTQGPTFVLDCRDEADPDNRLAELDFLELLGAEDLNCLQSIKKMELYDPELRTLDGFQRLVVGDKDNKKSMLSSIESVGVFEINMRRLPLNSIEGLSCLSTLKEVLVTSCPNVEVPAWLDSSLPNPDYKFLNQLTLLHFNRSPNLCELDWLRNLSADAKMKKIVIGRNDFEFGPVKEWLATKWKRPDGAPWGPNGLQIAVILSSGADKTFKFEDVSN